MRSMGTPWCIYTGIADGDLVIPIPAKSLPGGIANDGSGSARSLKLDSQRIIILGFHYDYVAANTNGFDLAAREYTFSPAGGSGTIRTIIESRATTANTQVSSSSECFIPLDGGRYVSPDIGNGADLIIENANVSSGNLVIWGVITDADESIVPNNNRLGLPFNAGSPPIYG